MQWYNFFLSPVSYFTSINGTVAFFFCFCQNWICIGLFYRQAKGVALKLPYFSSVSLAISLPLGWCCLCISLLQERTLYPEIRNARQRKIIKAFIQSPAAFEAAAASPPPLISFGQPHRPLYSCLPPLGLQSKFNSSKPAGIKTNCI